MDQFVFNIKEIRKFYSLIFNKDCPVHFTFKGNELGVIKVWNIKIDNREVDHQELDEAALKLLNLLKEELSLKISQLESQATHLRKALGDFKN